MISPRALLHRAPEMLGLVQRGTHVGGPDRTGLSLLPDSKETSFGVRTQ